MRTVAAGPIARAARAGGCLLGLALATLGAARADDDAPVVVRVRVPEGRVAAAFPPGTPMRTLPIAEFDALVARAESRQPGRSGGESRPVRVEHRVAWDGGALVGRSLVTLPATRGEPAVVACDPWSPTLGDSPDRVAFARVDPAGRLVLVQPPDRPARTVEIPWRQSALADSEGRGFALRLPAADVASVTVDLPVGVRVAVDAADAAPRLGPRPGAPAGMARWGFDGASGRLSMFFAPGPGPAVPTAWLGGGTRVDLDAPGPNWAAEWSVERPTGGALTLRIAADEGLELLDAAGPDVRSSRPAGPGALDVDLDGDGSDRSRTSLIVVRGLARVPAEGAWAIPSARAVGAPWLGGRTEVRLDPARAVLAVEPRAGRRVGARAGEAVPPNALLFESDGRPGPLAVLQLGRPAADASVAIRGSLRIGPAAPRAEVVATWQVDRGHLVAPSLDFPPGWAVDRVAGGDGGEELAWRTESIGAGGPTPGQRLHLDGPVGGVGAEGGSWTATIGATWVGPTPTGGGDAIAFPRARPTVGPARARDELWEARVESGWRFEPATSRGLAWVEPSGGPASSAPEGGAGLGLDPGGRAAGANLAWRWVADDAAATGVRRPDRPGPRLDERVEVVLAGGRLRLAWSWTIAEAGRPDALPFHLDIGPAATPTWRLVGPARGGGIEPVPLDPTRRAELGLPADGQAGDLRLDRLPRGSVSVRGEVEVPWGGTGGIPLPRVAGPGEVRRSVVVRVEEAARLRVDRSEGLEAVGLGGLADAGPEGEPAPLRAIVGDAVAGLRVAGAWVGTGVLARLDATTTPPPDPDKSRAVVAEASLTSRVSPATDWRHRLVLRVAPGGSRWLDLVLPPGTGLDRARRDGQPATALDVGGTLRVALAAADDAPRPFVNLTLDYRTAAALEPDGTIRPSRLLPTTTAPCLSFTWQVNAPEGFDVRSASPDLVAADLADLADLAGAASSPGPVPAEAPSPAPTARLGDLDAALVDAPAVETTLGAWLTRLDAGRWPLVLDRLAIGGIGWGPGSRINVVDPAPGRPTSAAATFHALGLAVEPMGPVLLITTEAERRVAPGWGRWSARDRAAIGRALLDAAVAGSDRSDRFQSPSRWLGEPTPRSWLASETPDRGLVAIGWRPHRFAAANWPAPGVAVAVRDPRAAWRRTGFAGAAIVALVAAIGLAVRGRSRVRAGGGGAIAAAACCLATCTALGGPAPLTGGPVRAILPLVGDDAVDSKPTRVVLAWADHDRLVRLAQGDPGTTSRTWLVDVVHRLASPAGGAVVVESRYDLEVVGGTGAWTVPVGASFDLAATVDGRPVPVAIGPDGRTATIRPLPPGRSVATLRRLVRFVPTPGPGPATPGGSAEVAVGSAPGAQVEVARGGWVGPIVVAGLEVDNPGAADVAGRLGPCDRVAARWGPAPARDDSSRAEVAAAVRWDAQPAGDRLDVRLTVTGGRPLGSIRLDLEPGLAVIGRAVPGLVGSMATDRGGRPGWIALVDPPLPPGATCELSLWRPAPAAPSPGATRAAPRWGLVGPTTAGVLGLRVPDGWAGRLISAGGRPAVAPAADFDRAWGGTPGEAGPLVAAIPWDPALAVAAEVGPRPPARWAPPHAGGGRAAGRPPRAPPRGRPARGSRWRSGRAASGSSPSRAWSTGPRPGGRPRPASTRRSASTASRRPRSRAGASRRPTGSSSASPARPRRASGPSGSRGSASPRRPARTSRGGRRRSPPPGRAGRGPRPSPGS